MVAIAGGAALIHNQPQHHVASATVVLRQLQASSSTAVREHTQLVRDVRRNKAGIAINSGSIDKMQASINRLTGDVHQLSDTVTKLGASLRALTKRVDNLKEHQACRSVETSGSASAGQ